MINKNNNEIKYNMKTFLLLNHLFRPVHFNEKKNQLGGINIIPIYLNCSQKYFCDEFKLIDENKDANVHIAANINKREKIIAG
jgi:hypothetical protein